MIPSGLKTASLVIGLLAIMLLLSYTVGHSVQTDTLCIKKYNDN